jgi:predicted dehydrogenase
MAAVTTPSRIELSMPPDRRGFLAASSALGLSAASYRRAPGAGERVGVGVIGYGLIGQRHVSTFAARKDVDLVALAEAHRGRRDEGLKAAGRGAKGYDDFRRLLDSKAVQAVVVATPDHWHALMTMLACDAGKDVYVEKPLTLFVREGEWMLAVAKRTKRVVQVGTQQRSGKHYRQARETVRKGHIGRVVSVRLSAVRNVMPGFGRPADQRPPAGLDWDRWLGPAPARKYNPNRCLYHFRWFWDYSGGQMTNLGAHHLDIVDWILGLERLEAVTSVGGRFALEDNGETPDTQDALFELGRWTAAFTMRECARGSAPAFGLEFFGTKGSLGLSRSGFTVSADPDLPPLAQVPGARQGHPAGGPKAAVPKTTKPRTKALVDRSGDSDAQYSEHARDFLDCIRSRKTPVSDLESAHRTALACHLANLSLRLGRKLRWDAKAKTVADDAAAARALVRPYRAPWDRELKALKVG